LVSNIFRAILGSSRLLACVASVPVRSERNSGHAKEFFAFGPREKWDESKKVEGRRWGRGKEGTLARKPLDFENRPLLFTVEFIY